MPAAKKSLRSAIGRKRRQRYWESKSPFQSDVSEKASKHYITGSIHQEHHRIRIHHSAVPGMTDRRRLPPDGGGNSKLSALAELCNEDRSVGMKPSDPKIPNQINVRKDDLCDVPRKMPRFQYVDFPSLHQCIQQFSVPPPNNCLGSCSLTTAPSYKPSSPKQNVPKFKYVDYPSLHHCIQQLSVPPLESWSAGLVRFSGRDDSGLELSQPRAVGRNQSSERNQARDERTEDRSASLSTPNDKHNSSTGRINQDDNNLNQDELEKCNASLGFRGTAPEFPSEPSVRFQSDSVDLRNSRPSVISKGRADQLIHWKKQPSRVAVSFMPTDVFTSRAVQGSSTEP